MTRVEAEKHIVAGDFEPVLAAIEQGAKDAARARELEEQRDCFVRLSDCDRLRAEKLGAIVNEVKDLLPGAYCSVPNTRAVVGLIEDIRAAIQREEGK